MNIEQLIAKCAELTASLDNSEAHVKRLQIDIANNYVHKDKVAAAKSANLTETIAMIGQLKAAGLI